MKDLVDDLGETGIVLNSAAPMKCSMGTPCDDDEYTFWNWQKDMLDEIEAGVRREGLWFMQDKESIDMWNNGITFRARTLSRSLRRAGWQRR